MLVCNRVVFPWALNLLSPSISIASSTSLLVIGLFLRTLVAVECDMVSTDSNRATWWNLHTTCTFLSLRVHFFLLVDCNLFYWHMLLCHLQLPRHCLAFLEHYQILSSACSLWKLLLSTTALAKRQFTHFLSTDSLYNPCNIIFFCNTLH